MKKVLFSVAGVFAFGFANAQDTPETTFGLTKGNIFLEGSFSFAGTNDKNIEFKTGEVGFTPKVGYMISDNLGLGVMLDVMSYKEELEGSESYKESSIGVGVFARYYFLNLGERFKTFAEVGAGFANGKAGLDDELKTSGFGIGLDLGINYFVTRSIAISFGLSDVISYNSMKMEAGGVTSEPVSELNVNANVFNNFFSTPTFGVMYKF
jgi:outer membrane protein